MKQLLVKIVQYLKKNTNYNKNQIIMIINPLETKEQAQTMLNWIMEQKEMNWSLMRKKALEIKNQ